MSQNHGVYVTERATSFSVPLTAQVGIPFIIGAAPVQSAQTQAAVGAPIFCTSFAEAVEKLGYSEDWEKYNLCEFMFSHFTLYGKQPAVFCNLLDIATMVTVIAAADIPVENNKALLPLEAINDESLVVKAAGGSGEPLILDLDFATYYSGANLVIELLADGTAYGATEINVAYRAVKPDAVTAEVVAMGLEYIEQCMTTVGVVPDLICAPGYSEDVTVAAVMATKAAGINGLFRAKALIDLSSDESGGATSYTDAVTLKKANNFVDENQIVCWPKLRLGERVYHMSTHLAGLIATVDGLNNGIPYESPSNKAFNVNGMVLASGQEVSLTHAQANVLGAQGILTALNFLGGWVAWGNYTACYPDNTDVKDFFISISRMFDWVGNTVIRTFWTRLDRPMNRRLVDSIIDTCNIWLNGLVGAGYLLGARVEFREDENPLADLMAGIIRVHIFMTPPGPAQEINFILEYDASYVAAAFGG